MTTWTSHPAVTGVLGVATLATYWPGSTAREVAGPSCFEDVTATSGVAFVHVAGPGGRYWIPEEMGPGAAVLDFDGDGALDIFLVQGGDLSRPAGNTGARLYRNDGAGHFSEVRDSGAEVTCYGMGAAAADIDNDGDVDLYVTCVGPDVLLRNEGGHFTDITRAAGIDAPGFGTSAVFADFDRDGLLDLFVAHYLEWAPHHEMACFDRAGVQDYCDPLVYAAPAADRLFLNLGNGRFQDISASSGIAAARGHSLAAAAADFDGDGWTDLYVASDQTPGLLWMNHGNGRFSEEGAVRGVARNADGLAIAGMGIAVADLDVDGDPDVLVTNIFDQPHLGLRNDRGLFEDSTHRWGLGSWSVPATGFGIAVFDQDHDGALDGLVANGAVNRRGAGRLDDNPFAEPNHFIRQRQDGRFVDDSAAGGPALRRGMSRAVAMGDLDNDGDLDAVITHTGQPVQLLRNMQATAQHWVILDLRPASGNRHAIGAVVRVTAAGRTHTRYVLPHANYLATHDPRVHIGLADAGQLDTVDITWPDGQSTVWTALPVDHVVTLHQAEAGP